MQKRMYTLVEMLVVMAIAAIIMALGIPAFQKLASGDKLAGSASLIKGYVEQAQSRAVTNRRHVAVVFDQTGRNFKGQGQGIGMCFADKVSDTNFNFGGLVDGVSWTQLPSGILLIDSNLNGTFGAPPNSIPNGLPNTGSINWDSHNYSALIFSPYGDIIYPANQIYFKLAEGIITGTNNIVYTNLDTDGRPADSLRLQVNRFTGKTETMR